jgi:hypothetical protein
MFAKNTFYATQKSWGANCVVEIDESLFAKAKPGPGRPVPQLWVFGGYEPATKKGFLVTVPRRDAGTLLAVIQQWIRPGTTVHSDQWGAYNQLANIGYAHGTVNHTLHFVDPNTGVTTNRVESMWQRAKAKFKAGMGPTNRNMIGDYFVEFMWGQRFGKQHAFYNICTHISEQYPVLQ